MTNAVSLERDGAVAVIIIDNPPVNATSVGVRAGLLAAVRAVDADAGIKAAVLIGAGKTFVAGADIREFDAPLADPQMPEVIAAIMDSPKAFVAALHGAALGGGFELALACDSRICATGTRVGLPEVGLGMIPGAGGTQHLPRLVGIAAAIEIVASARHMRADEARKLGLIDRLATGDLRSEAINYAPSVRKRRVRDLPLPPADAAQVDAAEKAALEAGKHRPQVAAAIAAVRSAATLPYGQALAREREVFQQLRASPEAAALRYVFFAEREAAKASGDNDRVIGELLVAAGRKHDEAALASFGYAPGIAPERRERRHAALAQAGARLVKEGHARNAAHIDLVLIRDHGFPRHEGGPMFRAALAA